MKIELEMTAEAVTSAYTVIELPDDLTPEQIQKAAEEFRDNYEEFPEPEIIGDGAVSFSVLDDSGREADEFDSERFLEIVERQRDGAPA
jgi:hypothetical protein